MNRIVITNSHLISYSGEVVLQDDAINLVGIKPSIKSKMCVFFKKEDIYRVIYPDGKTTVYNELDDKHTTEEIVEDGILVRLDNGVAFRGVKEASIIGKWTEEEGFFLYPTKSKNMFFWIPQDEVKQIYTQDK